VWRGNAALERDASGGYTRAGGLSRPALIIRPLTLVAQRVGIASRENLTLLDRIASFLIGSSASPVL